jgi:hypothetical protein
LKANTRSNSFKRTFAEEVKKWISEYRERVKPFERKRTKRNIHKTRENKKSQQKKP